MGRPKGAKNKRSITVEMIASRFDIDPFEVLMMIATGDWKGLGYETKTHTTFTMNGIEIEEENIPIAQRAQAARDAARYLYSQKQTISHDLAEGEFKRLLVERMKLLAPKLITDGENDGE